MTSTYKSELKTRDGSAVNMTEPSLWCARHARDLDGESPLRGLIAPTVSRRQGCPSRGGI